MPLVDHRHIDRMMPRTSIAAQRAPLESANGALLRRAQFLAPRDRLLVEMAFEKQLSHRQIGQLMSIPAGTVTRRLQRICRRLRDPMIVLLMDECCPLPPDQRDLALEHFLNRCPATELSRLHQVPRWEINRRLDYVRGWYRGISHRRLATTS